jgi:hypothetical protein
VPEGEFNFFLATRSGGCIRREPEMPTWASGRQRRASGAWWKPSTLLDPRTRQATTELVSKSYRIA